MRVAIFDVEQLPLIFLNMCLGKRLFSISKFQSCNKKLACECLLQGNHQQVNNDDSLRTFWKSLVLLGSCPVVASVLNSPWLWLLVCRSTTGVGQRDMERLNATQWLVFYQEWARFSVYWKPLIKFQSSEKVDSDNFTIFIAFMEEILFGDSYSMRFLDITSILIILLFYTLKFFFNWNNGYYSLNDFMAYSWIAFYRFKNQDSNHLREFI